jgi:hypothetical protein
VAWLSAVAGVTRLIATVAGITAATACFAQETPSQADPVKQMQHIDLLAFNRGAVSKSLPLLQKTAEAFNAQMDGKCFSCHHQTLPSVTMALAREHGFKVDEQKAQEQTKVVKNLLDQLGPLLEKSETSPAANAELDQIFVDPGMTVPYGLFGLAADGVKSDKAIAAAVKYLMRKQSAEGYWPVWSARPPLESSEFTSTALAVRVMKVYAPASASKETASRIARARAWLLTTHPKTLEDSAFRLLGLKWSGAETGDIKSAAADLLALQHDDGGWGQMPGMASDAYATGQALVALKLGGDHPVGSGAYRRGSFYLAVTQQKDGSWLVAKRANPVQPFFDSSFPHDQSQFISCAGTCWATMALTLSLPASPVQTARAAR